jgi:hypothetical protein
MPVEHLVFVTNSGTLLSAAQDQILHWDIVERSSTPLARLGSPITKLYLADHLPSPSAQFYVYIGLSNGDLRVLSLQDRRVTSFCLKFETVWSSAESSAVVDMAMHPKEESQILIAYSRPGLALWDLKSTKCVKRFEADEPLQCAAWQPAAAECVAGTSEGSIVFWRTKDKVTRPYKKQQVKEPHEDVNVAPVQKVLWLDKQIVILGGQPYSDPCNVMLLTGENFTVKLPFVKGQPVLALVEAPLFEGLSGSKENVFVVTDRGSLYSYDFPVETGPNALLSAVPGVLGPGRIMASELISVAVEGEAVLGLTALLTKTEVDPLQTALLITAHEDGLVHFWALQGLKMNYIGVIAMSAVPYRLGPQVLLQLDLEDCKVSLVKLSVSSQSLVLGYNLGFIGIFKISPEGVSLAAVQQLNPSPILRAVLAGETLALGDFDCNLTVYNLAELAPVLRTDLKVPPPADKQKTFAQDLIVNELVYVPPNEASSSRLLAGLSNGTLRAFDALTWEYLKSPESPLKDTKSPSPKRSEVGIIKLLWSLAHPQLLAVVYQQAAFQLQLADMKTVLTQRWDVPAVSAAIINLSCKA